MSSKLSKSPFITIAVALACLDCAGQARRLQNSHDSISHREAAHGGSQRENISAREARVESRSPSTILATLLLRSNPATAFNPSIRGLSSSAGSHAAGLDRRPRIARGFSVMSEDEPSARHRIRAAARCIGRVAATGTCSQLVAMLLPAQLVLAASQMPAAEPVGLIQKTLSVRLFGVPIVVPAFLVGGLVGGYFFCKRQLFQYEIEHYDTWRTQRPLQEEKIKEMRQKTATLQERSSQVAATGTPSTVSPAASTEKKEQSIDAAVTPPAEKKKPKPKKLFGVFGKKQTTVDVPSVAELTSGDSNKADFCKTLAWALKASVDLSLSNNATAEAIEKDGPTAFALSVAEELQAARDKSREAGMSRAAMAESIEQVCRALTIEFVDAAVDKLDTPSFDKAAGDLCLFVQNAQYGVISMGAEKDVQEVLYQGAKPKRKLERVYGESIKLASSDLLAALGLDDEGDTQAVSIDKVEALWPLLGIRQQRAERLMQDAMQKQMMKMMKDDGGLNLEDKSPAAQKKMMTKSMDMLEQMVDSGAFTGDDLQALRKSLEEQMGMSVEDVLERKEELRRELPEEEAKILDLVEKLFDPNRPTPAPAPPGATPEEEQTYNEEDIDPTMEMKVKKSSAPPPDEAPSGSSGTTVKIKIKKKSGGTSAPATPEPAPVAAAPAAISPMDVTEENKEAPKEEAKPVEEAPKEEAKPMEEAPKEEAKPVEEAPKEEAKPVEEAPKEEAKPVEEAPKEEAKPVEEAPKEEVEPVEEAPKEEAKPVEEAPKEEVKSVDEAPKEEAKPVEEAPEEEAKPVEEVPPEAVETTADATTAEPVSVDSVQEVDDTVPPEAVEPTGAPEGEVSPPEAVDPPAAPTNGAPVETTDDTPDELEASPSAVEPSTTTATAVKPPAGKRPSFLDALDD